MDHTKLSREEEPIRLFQSDILEFFTHIHPGVVVALWLPVAIYAFIYAARDIRLRWSHVGLGALVGFTIWTFIEYTLHRFVFHFKPRNAWQERASFLFHGIHHAQPRSKTRLVMPPAVSVPLGIVFYGLFRLVVGQWFRAPGWVAPLFAGFTTGYLAYDLTHYATHHFRMKRGYFKWVRQHHMRHHAQTPDMRFGVSSPLWDYVFGTEPR